jgi:diacylglycerol O-acyltransferase
MNVAISNVPGPQSPLYFAGAKLVTYYPVSIPAHGGALNMTVQSYNGSLDFGLTACRRALPDVADLANDVVDEHRKLLALIAGRDPAQALAPAAAAQKIAPRKAKAAAPAARPAATVVKAAASPGAKPARRLPAANARAR